ncbi:ABC transporter ATP-binding protein [Pseudonocardia cypriaca]|uniref:Putative ABC transport system ATP-binding protein n=1 Tax=Pseudonocardia cypriaca TaxID=882449 RepID=A0A543FXH9_9PSEU|nr:ABC transporter ATP-binding protein [Pseudonocardia cypriaca]TQM38548.1 putative ABC transport system ATP-binding protein [Pseudonocardia cypriaca]
MTAPAAPRPARPVAASTWNLVKIYGRGAAAVQALNGVSLQIPAARFTAIMGPSGSGKSTLMHLLAGLDTATSGQVRLGETDLTRCSDAHLTALRRDRIGYVFQSFNLLPQLTAEQNIELPARLAGRAIDPGWRSMLIGMLGLGNRMRHRPTELSGGQQQRVAVARALLGRPEVVFADEPTGNLDTASGHELLDLLRGSVRNTGQTVVMVTHDPIAASYADEVVLLRDGHLAGVLPNPRPDTVLAALSSLSRAGGLGGRPGGPHGGPPRPPDTGPMPEQPWDGPPPGRFAGPPMRPAGA